MPIVDSETDAGLGSKIASLHTVVFSIRSLCNKDDADIHALEYDLRNTITGLDGVAHVGLDRSSGSLTVTYDSAFVSPGTVRASIVGAGYPIEDGTSDQ